MKWTATEIAVLGMATTVLVAVLSALVVYFASKRERRQILYSEAVQAILSWNEMLYRVRRRDKNQARDLISSFHDLQEKLSYYEVWIASESIYMSRSYSRLVKAIKLKTESLIRDAWQESIRVEPGDSLAIDKHPAVKSDVDAFLRDVRSHLSPFPWRKIAIAYRNRRDQR